MTKRRKPVTTCKAHTELQAGDVMSHGHFSHLDEFQRRMAVARMIDLSRILDGVRARLRGAA